MLSKISAFILFFSCCFYGLTVPVRAESQLFQKLKDDTLTSNQNWLNRHGLKKEVSFESDSSLLIHNLDGERIIGQRGVKSPPKLATGSMEFFGGVATVTFSNKRDRRKSSLIASSADDLHILGIYGVTVDSTVINRTLDTIKVYSSGASDTTVAQILLVVQ